MNAFVPDITPSELVDDLENLVDKLGRDSDTNLLSNSSNVQVPVCVC